MLAYSSLHQNSFRTAENRTFITHPHDTNKIMTSLINISVLNRSVAIEVAIEIISSPSGCLVSRIDLLCIDSTYTLSVIQRIVWLQASSPTWEIPGYAPVLKLDYSLFTQCSKDSCLWSCPDPLRGCSLL